MSLNEQFQSACTQVQQFKKKPKDDELLQLYGLYKQAIIGDINIDKPGDMKGKAKWDAWNERKGISQEDAKKNYVEITNTLSQKYM